MGKPGLIAEFYEIDLDIFGVMLERGKAHLITQ